VRVASEMPRLYNIFHQAAKEMKKEKGEDKKIRDEEESDLSDVESGSGE